PPHTRRDFPPQVARSRARGRREAPARIEGTRTQCDRPTGIQVRGYRSCKLPDVIATDQVARARVDPRPAEPFLLDRSDVAAKDCELVHVPDPNCQNGATGFDLLVVEI